MIEDVIDTLRNTIQLSIKCLLEKATLRQVPVTGSREFDISILFFSRSSHSAAQCLKSLNSKPAENEHVPSKERVNSFTLDYETL